MSKAATCRASELRGLKSPRPERVLDVLTATAATTWRGRRCRTASRRPDQHRTRASPSDRQVLSLRGLIAVDQVPQHGREALGSRASPSNAGSPDEPRGCRDDEYDRRNPDKRRLGRRPSPVWRPAPRAGHVAVPRMALGLFVGARGNAAGRETVSTTGLTWVLVGARRGSPEPTWGKPSRKSGKSRSPLCPEAV
jgi:hypothetical protein